jgi:hypothetical protein
MTRKLAFMLVTTVAFGAVPQIAHASCSGNACSALTMKPRGYSSAESLLHFDLTNSDKSRAIKSQSLHHDGRELRSDVRPDDICRRNLGVELPSQTGV